MSQQFSVNPALGMRNSFLVSESKHNSFCPTYLENKNNMYKIQNLS